MNCEKTKQYLIIGQGAAGMAAANELRRLDANAAVTVITEETEGFYSRIDLPDIVSGLRKPQDALLQSLAQFRDKGIHCLTGMRASRIFPEKHSVEFFSGQCLKYDKLLLATGSQPALPKIPGLSVAKGIYTLWTLQQAAELSQAATGAKYAVVLGAGLIGLKTALALRKRGLSVTVIERQSRIMPQQLDETGAAILEAALTNKGIEFFTGAAVEAIETKDGRICGIKSGMRQLPCDLAVIAAGVRPDTALARTAGVVVGTGITADEYLQTSNPDIYVAGDAAEINNVFGSRVLSAGWPAAVEQGVVAARNMSGGHSERYTGYLAKNSVELAGLPFVSAGNVQGDDGMEILTQRNGNVYKRLVIQDSRLQGFLVMGNIRYAGVLAGMIGRAGTTGYASTAENAYSYVDLMAL